MGKAPVRMAAVVIQVGALPSGRGACPSRVEACPCGCLRLSPGSSCCPSRRGCLARRDETSAAPLKACPMRGRSSHPRRHQPPSERDRRGPVGLSCETAGLAFPGAKGRAFSPISSMPARTPALPGKKDGLQSEVERQRQPELSLRS